MTGNALAEARELSKERQAVLASDELERRRAEALRTQEYCYNFFPQEPAYFEHVFPTGKLIVANDLRHLIREGISHDVNRISGVIATTQDYAAQGMAHYFVGNTCPSIYYDRNRGLVVGCPASRAYDAPGSPDNPGRLPYRRYGSVTTDLWWVCIIDEQDYFRLGGTQEYLDIGVAHGNIGRFTVEPGRYIGRGFRGYKSHLAPNKHEFGQAEVMAALVRSGDPVPLNWASPIQTLVDTLKTCPNISAASASHNFKTRIPSSVKTDQFDRITDTEVRIVPAGLNILRDRKIHYAATLDGDATITLKKRFNYKDILNGTAVKVMIDWAKRMKKFYDYPEKFLKSPSDADLEVLYAFMEDARGVFNSPFGNLLNYGTRIAPPKQAGRNPEQLAKELIDG